MKKIAVVGLGNISNRHRRNIKKLFPQSFIYAVSASGNFPSEDVVDADAVCLNLNELPMNKLDFSIVASPATLHAEHSLHFIRAGVPTLIEKPLSATNEHAVTVLNAVEDFKTPVAVGYCLRYLSSAKEIRKILSSNLVGDIYNVHTEIGQYLPDWRPGKDYKNTVSASRELGGGALLELSHELDYLAWLFGEIQPVSAVLRSSDELNLNVEDSADILAKSKSSVITIHLDFLQKKAHRQCRIIGSKAVLEWNLIKNQINYVDERKEKMIFDGSQDDRNQMYLDMLMDFQAKISGQKNTCITVEEALETVNFINKVKKMAENN